MIYDISVSQPPAVYDKTTMNVVRWKTAVSEIGAGRRCPCRPKTGTTLLICKSRATKPPDDCVLGQPDQFRRLRVPDARLGPARPCSSPGGHRPVLSGNTPESPTTAVSCSTTRTTTSVPARGKTSKTSATSVRPCPTSSSRGTTLYLVENFDLSLFFRSWISNGIQR